jgi:uncharacterized protein (DUF302 family)
MTYCYKKTTTRSFHETEQSLRESLKAEGFGIITEIDVQKTIKEKLGIDTDKYKIIGACNPTLAYQAINAEPDIGVLLPCNVIIRQAHGKTVISAILPTVQLGKVGNPLLQPIAAIVEGKLKEAVDRTAP